MQDDSRRSRAGIFDKNTFEEVKTKNILFCTRDTTVAAHYSRCIINHLTSHDRVAANPLVMLLTDRDQSSLNGHEIEIVISPALY